MVGKERVGQRRESNIDIYILPDDSQWKLLCPQSVSSVLGEDLERWDGGRTEGHEGRDVCIHVLIRCCTEETDTTL